MSGTKGGENRQPSSMQGMIERVARFGAYGAGMINDALQLAVFVGPRLENVFVDQPDVAASACCGFDMIGAGPRPCAVAGEARKPKVISAANEKPFKIGR